MNPHTQPIPQPDDPGSARGGHPTGAGGPMDRPSTGEQPTRAYPQQQANPDAGEQPTRAHPQPPAGPHPQPHARTHGGPARPHTPPHGQPGGQRPQQPASATWTPAPPAKPLTLSGGARTAFRVTTAAVAAIAVLIPTSALAVDVVRQLNTVTKTEEVALPEDLSTLTVDGGAAFVSVTATDAVDAPVLTHSYRGREDGFAPASVDVSGSEAVVAAPASQGFAAEVLGRDRSEYSIEIPTELAEGLDIRTDVGFSAVDITGAFATLDLVSTSGAVDLDGSAREVAVSAKSGAVSGEIAADVLSVTTRSGLISLERVGASKSIELSARTGAVSAELDAALMPAEGMDVRATSGAVTLELPDETELEHAGFGGYDIRTSVASGTVDDEVSELGQGTVSGSRMPLTAQVSSGSIDISYGGGFPDPFAWQVPGGGAGDEATDAGTADDEAGAADGSDAGEAADSAEEEPTDDPSAGADPTPGGVFVGMNRSVD